jgi:PAS domain S-box-containing protein
LISYIRNLSIRMQLTVLCLIILIPLLAYEAIQIRREYRNLFEHEVQANLEIARAVRRLFVGYVDTVLRAETGIIIAISEKRHTPEEISRILTEYERQTKLALNFGWLSPECRVIASSNPGAIGMDLSDRPYLLQVAQGADLSISDLLVGRVAQVPVFQICKAVRDDSGNLKGILVASIDEERLENALSFERSRSAGIALIDRKGMLVFRYPRIETSWEDRNWLKFYPFIQDVLAGKEYVGTYTANYDAKPRIIANLPTPFGWIAGAGRSEDEVVGIVLSQLQTSLVIFGLILAAALIAVTVVSKQITGSVMALQEQSDAIAHGEFVAKEHLASTKEFQSLSNALNTMSEKVRAREEGLRESEAKFRALTQNLVSAVALINERGEISIVNKAFLRLFDLAEDTDILNVNSRDWSKWQVFDEAGQLLGVDEHPVRKAARTRAAVRDVLVAVQCPGRADWKWVLISAEPILNAQGNLHRLICTYHDVTERKQAEEALLQERDFSTAVLSTAGALVVVLDKEGRITRFNLACEKTTGYRGKEVLGRVFFDLLVPQEEIHGVRQTWNSLCAGDFPNEHENHWVAKDGTRRLIAWSNAALTREDGEIDNIIATGVDITERKQAEEELQTTLQRFYKILSGLNSSVLLVTDTNQVEYANQAFCDYFGLQESPTELKHLAAREMIQKIKDAYHDPSEAVTRISQIVTRGEPVINEEVSMQGERTCLRNYIPLNLDGKSYGRLWHHWDITERKQAEMALAELNEMLERKVEERTADLHAANQALEERAAQLRSLAGELTTAEQRQRKSIAKLLHDGLQQFLVAARLRQSGLIEQLGDHAAKQSAQDVEGLLTESISVSRSLSIELCPPVLDGGILAGLEWLTRFMAAKHGLNVSIITETAAPILPEDVKIFMFESVRELLLNVVKHSKTLSAKVHLKEDQQRLQVVVSDSGAGFDMCALQRRKVGGAFGLFSIRERIGLVGGSIEIDSSPGMGSRFTLSVPFDKHDALHSNPAPPCNIGASGGCEADVRIRILVADDHKVMRESLALMLGREDDFEIVGQAEDGKMAVELTQTLHPRIVLMDINMPNMDGITATRIIAQSHPDVHVIGLSFYKAEERADDMIKAGARLYVSKSAPADELKQAIRSCVDANSAKVKAA